MLAVMNDLRYALRQLRQSPGYAVTAVLTLALAIGANSAIFSAVNAVLLRPLPVDTPRDLAVVWQTDAGGQAVIELTVRHLREWTGAGRTFTRAAVMASHNWSAALEGRGEPSRIWFNGVSADFFATLGVRPILGRDFRPDDDVPNAAPVAILNHGTWARRFGSDPNVVGSTIVLDGGSVEVIGVMPPGVDFPRGAELWVPVVPIIAGGTPPNTGNLDTFGVFYVVGRTRAGLDSAAVRAEIDSIEARLDRADTGRLKWGSRTVATPFVDYVFGPVRPALRVLWAAVGVLLLIACANVSGLALTRAAQRQQDHAIRRALGASRASIARLWLGEMLIVAAAGGALGLALAQWLTHAIVVLAPDDLPRLESVSVDAPVALFTFAAVIIAALVTAAMPLRHAGSAGVVSMLDGDRTTSSRRTQRARSALLVAQIALSVVLLIAAGLVLRSFLAVRQIDLGFTPDRVLSATVQPRGVSEAPNVWLDRFLERIRVQPGIEAAGAVYLRPLKLGPIGQNVRVFLEGQPETRESADANPTLNHQIATPGYFEALRSPLKAGRLFTAQDTAAAPPVAIVGESTARRLWPGQEPIGRRLSMATFTPGGPPRAWRTVVGVVSDVRYRALDEAQLDVYVPALQTGRPADNIVVRTAGDPLAFAASLRAIARELHSSALVEDVTTLDAVVTRAEAPWRLTMWMFVLFAALAFALAILGLFSVVALDVAHSGRELAIRLSLGASRGSIVRRMVLRAGWRVSVGIGLGLFAAVATGRAMRGLLFGIAPHDAPTYAAVLTVVLIAVVVAAYVPARRAARTDPNVVLRQE
jgi:putative ABC transport system permease protein